MLHVQLSRQRRRTRYNLLRRPTAGRCGPCDAAGRRYRSKPARGGARRQRSPTPPDNRSTQQTEQTTPAPSPTWPPTHTLLPVTPVRRPPHTPPRYRTAERRHHVLRKQHRTSCRRIPRPGPHCAANTERAKSYNKHDRLPIVKINL